MITPPKLPACIRWAIRDDIPAIVDIERHSFENPLIEKEILCILRKRNCIAMVAEYDNAVIGFMIYELYVKKYVVLDLAVSPQFRRQSIGRQMMEKMIDKLNQTKRSSLLLTVRDKDLVAHKFLRAIGIKATKILRGYYENSDEDAYLFEYKLNGVYVPKLERIPNRW